MYFLDRIFGLKIKLHTCKTPTVTILILVTKLNTITKKYVYIYYVEFIIIVIIKTEGIYYNNILGTFE